MLEMELILGSAQARTNPHYINHVGYSGWVWPDFVGFAFVMFALQVRPTKTNPGVIGNYSV